MKKFLMVLLAAGVTVGLTGCDDDTSARSEETNYQNELMEQAADEVGMPDITEFYEKKLAKEIFELRDDSELICYAYTRSDMSGKYVYLGRCMGYGLPYSTQYTCPETAKRYNGTPYTIEQADPNGLYSPEGLSATWLWLIDEKTGEPNVTYIESEITVLQQKLPARLCEEWSLGEDY